MCLVRNNFAMIELTAVDQPKMSRAKFAGPLIQKLRGKNLLSPLLALLPVLGMTVQAAAAAVPPTSLFGKSVVISWSETRQRREIKESNVQSVVRNESLTVYVATAGRVFRRISGAARVSETGRGWTAALESAPGDISKSIISFSGRVMTFFDPFLSGAVRRIVVDFDAGFGACSARVGYAKESGHATSTIGSLDGKRVYEILAFSAGSATCSVQNGNVFGVQ
jgi:hypothetical protein